MTHTDRRDFIKQGLIGAAGITIGTLATSARSYAQIRGANDRINMAVIGVRNQGTVHLQNLSGLKDSHNVQIRTVCDTDERLFARAVALVEQKTGAKPATEWDLHRAARHLSQEWQRWPVQQLHCHKPHQRPGAQ